MVLENEPETADEAPFLSSRGITLNQFFDLNPQILPDCSNLWRDYAYCVAPVSEAPISSDGSCGPENGHAVCDGSGYGGCCSLEGLCKCLFLDKPQGHTH